MQIHIRKIREEKKLTLQQVAEALGVTKAQVSKMERGIIRLNDVWMEKLAQTYNCSIHALIDDDEANNFPRESKLKAPLENVFCDAAMLGFIDTRQVGFVEYCDPGRQYGLRFERPSVMPKGGGELLALNLKGDFSDLYKDGSQLIFLRLDAQNSHLLKNGSVVLCRQKDRVGNEEGDFLRIIEKDEYGFCHAVYKIKYGRHSYSTPVRHLLAGEVGISGLIEIYNQMDNNQKSKSANKEIPLKNHDVDLIGVLVKVVVDV